MGSKRKKSFGERMKQYRLKKQRKASKTPRKTRKVIKSRKTRKSMAKRKGKRSGFSRARAGISNVLHNPMLKDAAAGAGAARLSHEVTERIPQIPDNVKPIIAVGAGYAMGGPVGAIAAAFTEGIVGSFGGGNDGGGDAI